MPAYRPQNYTWGYVYEGQTWGTPKKYKKNKNIKEIDLSLTRTEVDNIAKIGLDKITKNIIGKASKKDNIKNKIY